MELDYSTEPKTPYQTFYQVRQETEAICSPLQPEDYLIQPSSEVSPPKWHLAHTSWFFEELVLKPCLPNYSVYNPAYSELFNSYYKSWKSLETTTSWTPFTSKCQEYL